MQFCAPKNLGQRFFEKKRPKLIMFNVQLYIRIHVGRL